MSDPPPLRRKPSGCTIVLAVAVGLILAIKVIGYVQVDNQRLIWASHAPRNYILTGTYVALVPPAGTHTLTMKDGHGALEDGHECAADCPFLPAHMFDEVQGCNDWFPLMICSARYDPIYGFPTDFMSICMLPFSDCGASMTAHYFAPLK